MTAPALTVLCTPGCPFAAMLRLRLRLARIPYQRVDCTEDEAARATVRADNAGDELSPTVHIGTTFLSHPGLDRVRRALRDEGHR